MRFKCGLTYPGGKFSPLGFECDGTDHIVDLVTRVANGTQCEGGPMSLVIHDTREEAWMTIQRRSCHGFGEMVERAVAALDPPYVPERIGRW